MLEKVAVVKVDKIYEIKGEPYGTDEQIAILYRKKDLQDLRKFFEDRDEESYQKEYKKVMKKMVRTAQDKLREFEEETRCLYTRDFGGRLTNLKVYDAWLSYKRYLKIICKQLPERMHPTFEKYLKEHKDELSA